MFKSKMIKCLAAAAMLTGFQAQAIVIDSWTGEGTLGTLGADGDVPLSPFAGSTQYGYVSTDGSSENDIALPGIGGTGSGTNGSRIRSPLFAAEANDQLSFFFNYVTSDGAGFADYAFARLLDSALNEVALLFTARVTTSGDTVPGQDMPAPTASLDPATVEINANATNWSALGGSSGSCYATGCGSTGWVEALFTIADAGNYILEIGVVNWNDGAFQSGIAFDGATIGGVVIDDSDAVNAPAGLALFAFALLAIRRRFANK